MMDRDLKVKQFASALFSHVYKSYNTTYELPVKLPHTHNSVQTNEEFSDDVGKAVVLFCTTFHADFTQLFIKNFVQLQTSEKQYMEFLTSRCLKLCEDDVFLSFIITSSFICELNLFCVSNGCFSFMNTGPKCLIAIFNRRLKKEFYAHGGWEGLALFCENLVHPSENVEDYINSLTEHIQGNILNHLEESSDDSEDDEDSSGDEDSETEAAAAPNDQPIPANSELLVLQPLPILMEPPITLAVNNEEDEEDEDELETDESESSSESESDDSNEVEMPLDNSNLTDDSDSSEESDLSSISNKDVTEDEIDNT